MELSAQSFNQCTFYENFSEMIEMLEKNSRNVNETDLTSLISAHLDKVVAHPTYVNAPYCEDFEWLNSSRPIDFEADLSNKIYIIDFFTYCCINCLHILPYLKEVEEVMKNESSFAVIGVHSPKFLNEMDTDRLKDAILKYDITHPVLNDKNCILWKTYGITCWPTVLIVGPSHKLLFTLEGERQINKVLLLSKIIMKYFESSRDVVDSDSNMPVAPIVRPVTDGLLYPGNISSNDELLLVSDTKHNRLVLMTRSLAEKDIIGCGISGNQDGSFNNASFNSPHGTCWYGTTVYVADTGNHSIRKVDFLSRQVSTVFCLKENDADLDDSLKSFLCAKGFFSPWDVCIAPEMGSNLNNLNVLYIAVAGSHQIWSMNLESTNSTCAPFAGSGKEENRKNLYRFNAGFAQPTGIAYSSCSPKFLYVADSESSAIRSISLTDGSVSTICGGSLDPCDLFSFGDEDGISYNAKFQHPMGLCVINDSLLAVADTYNHKVKLIDTVKRSSETEGNMKLCEPGGICILDNALYIADTNHHCIKTLFIDHEIISNIIFLPLLDVVSTNSADSHYEAVEVAIKYEAKISCFFRINLPKGCTLTKPEVSWEILFKGKGYLAIRCNSTKLFNPDFLPALELTAENFCLIEGYDSAKVCEVTFVLHLDICNSSLGTCSRKTIEHTVVFKFEKHGARLVHLHLLNNL